jgi:hypothetical protein
MIRLRGEAVRRASRDSNQSRDAYVFGAVDAVSLSAMEHVFHVECFCIARQVLLVCLYANAKESLAEIAASPLAVG